MARIFLLVTVLLSSIAAAETPKKAPPRTARFFPVGEAPPFRQEIRDGVRYELEAPPGSIPPLEVLHIDSQETDKPTELRLGRISAPVKVPSGDGLYQLFSAADQPSEKPWHQFQRPESGDFLVLFWRKPGPAGWNEVSHLLLPDGPFGCPANTVCIANIFHQSVQLIWASEVIILKAGAHISKVIKPGSEVSIGILSAGPTGTAVRYFSTTVTQNPGERGWIVLYRADGENPRRPLKVLMIREPV